jgi:hypothetical protein
MTTFKAIAAAGAAITVLLAATACGGDDETVRQQIGAADDVSTIAEQAEDSQHQLGEQIAAIDEPLSDGSEQLMAAVNVIGVNALDRTADIPEPPAGKVALRFAFSYPGDPLPGDGLVIYRASSEVNSLWAMESLPAGQPVPHGDRLDEQVLFLDPGESQMVTLVYENPTSEPVGFLALPHQESPGSLGPKTWLTCFCLTFIWEAPEEGAWYRVIRVAVSPDTPAGSRIDATWTILTDPDVFPVN